MSPIAEFHPIFSAGLQKTLSRAVTAWAFITQSGFGSTKEKVRDPTTAHRAGIMWERCKRGMLISADKRLKTSLRLLCLLRYGPVDEPVLTWKQYKRPFISRFCISLPKRRPFNISEGPFWRDESSASFTSNHLPFPLILPVSSPPFLLWRVSRYRGELVPVWVKVKGHCVFVCVCVSVCACVRQTERKGEKELSSGSGKPRMIHGLLSWETR